MTVHMNPKEANRMKTRLLCALAAILLTTGCIAVDDAAMKQRYIEREYQTGSNIARDSRSRALGEATYADRDTVERAREMQTGAPIAPGGKGP